MALSMNTHLDPPSGSYQAPVKISLLGPDSSIGFPPENNKSSSSSPFAPISPFHRNNNNEDTSSSTAPIPSNCWYISIEHIDRIDDVFDGSAELRSQHQIPSQKSTFLYDGTFRITRAGKMRVCAWPVGGSYDTDRVVSIYYVDNPENAASSRGWTVERAPPSTVTHPLTSFVPFSFELSANQRYLPGKNKNPDEATREVIEVLPAEIIMTWNYDRQVQQQEMKRRSQEQQYQKQQENRGNPDNNSTFNATPTNKRRTNKSSLPAAYQVASSSSSSVQKTPTVTFVDDNNKETQNQTPQQLLPLPASSPHGLFEIPRKVDLSSASNAVLQELDDQDFEHSIVPRFSAPATVKAEVATSWEWTKGIRWSNDFGRTAEERYCIRVDRDCGFTKVNGVYGEWDAIVTTEAALPVPVQLDVTPLDAVNTVIGFHEEDVQIGHFQQWKEFDCSLHLASLSGTGERPEVMFRFFSHHPRNQLQQQLKTPLFEGEVPVGSTLSMRILPDSRAPGALILHSQMQLNFGKNNNNNNMRNNNSSSSSSSRQKFCEVKLFIDGNYLTSAFFPQKSHVRASCILSDPISIPALQIVPRAPKTHLKVSNIFFGAAPLKSPLEMRKHILQRHITRELEMAKASNYHSDLAHADPTCSVLFVEVKIDISGIESSTDDASASSSSNNNNLGGNVYVPLHLYWRPSWIEKLPPWTVKCLGTATQCMMKLFSLESGRSVENFEEAEEKSKQNSLMMQI